MSFPRARARAPTRPLPVRTSNPLSQRPSVCPLIRSPVVGAQSALGAPNRSIISFNTYKALSLRCRRRRRRRRLRAQHEQTRPCKPLTTCHPQRVRPTRSTANTGHRLLAPGHVPVQRDSAACQLEPVFPVSATNVLHHKRDANVCHTHHSVLSGLQVPHRSVSRAAN